MALLKIRRPSLAVRKPRKRVLHVRKTLYRMNGGPAKRLWLSAPGTLRFSINGFHGFYDKENKWVDL